MNDRQNTKLNMAQRVSNVLDLYSGVYANITPMVTAAGELKTAIGDIRHTDTQRAAGSITAASEDKNKAEEAMVEIALRFANALYVIGFTSNNAELTVLSNLSARSFFNATDNESLTQARRIITLAEANAEVLATYGLDTAALTDLKNATETFASFITKPMDIIGSRKQKTTTLAQLFAELDSIFYDKLDKLMVLFKQSAPDFYGEYRTARNLINTAKK